MKAYVIMTADCPHEVVFSEELAKKRVEELPEEKEPWGGAAAKFRYRYVHYREVPVSGAHPKTPPGAFGPEQALRLPSVLDSGPLRIPEILARMADEFLKEFTAMLDRLGSTPSARLEVFLDIAKERNRQDAKWGGPEHDNQHIPAEWCDFTDQHLRRALDAALDSEDEDTYRKQMIIVAALATAAVEAFDRLSIPTPEKESAGAAYVGTKYEEFRVLVPLSGPHFENNRARKTGDIIRPSDCRYAKAISNWLEDKKIEPLYPQHTHHPTKESDHE